MHDCFFFLILFLLISFYKCFDSTVGAAAMCHSGAAQVVLKDRSKVTSRGKLGFKDCSDFMSKMIVGLRVA